MIPFFPPDLFDDDRDVLLETVRAVGTAADQTFILGERTRELERALARELGAAEVVACGSGTAALTLILRAMGIGPADEVIVPAFGCAPLAATVVNLGATPVFADITEHTMVIDPDRVEALIGAHTRAIIGAHLFSVMADMPRLRAIADRHQVALVEDSAVAQGASLHGRPAGTWGDAGLFSFVQVKTFGAPGEGGVVVTGDAELAAAVRMLRNHGQGATRFRHERIGYNSRFDEVLADFQLHRLPGLAARLERRADIAEYYTGRFTPLRERGIVPPPSGRDGRCYYVYCLLADDRDALLDHLDARGVHAHVYYPRPLPRQPAFAHLAGDRRWPVAEDACRRILAIPVYSHLTDAQVTHIADAVCGFADRPEAANAR